MKRAERPAVMAAFASGPALLGGLRALRDAGLSRFDAFTPYEVDGLQEALGVRRSRLTWIALLQAWRRAAVRTSCSGGSTSSTIR